MSHSLSVRDENRFISAYKNLLNDSDERIHKGDLNILKRILSKCDKVVVGQLLMTKMESCPKDPVAFKNTFSKLFDKLEAQNSKMHDKKEEKLKNIQQKLDPVVQDIHKNEINAHNAKVNGKITGLAAVLQDISSKVSQRNNEIAKLQINITNADVQINKLNNEIQTLDDKLKNTSTEDFAVMDARRLKDTEAKISKLEAIKNAEISKLNTEIAAHKNSREFLLAFAKMHGVSSAEQDLIKAESGAIYDNRDTGFGPTSWREHLGSDKYAIKHFGYDLEKGRRQYSVPIKVPNQKGKQWQELMQNVNDAPKKIKALKTEISQLNKKYSIAIGEVLKNNLPAKKEIEQQINSIQKDIRSLEKRKEIASGKIKLCHSYISKLEAEKTLLIAEMKKLTLQIKKDS